MGCPVTRPFGDRPVVIEPIVVDGRRVLLVRPVVARKGVHPAHTPRDGVRLAYGIARTPRRRPRTGVVVALVVAVLGVLAAVGWAVYALLAFLLGHAWELGAVVALVALLAGGGGGCVITVTHIRR